jgi:hypothetical protein
MDALNIRRAVIGDYHWGGRAACVVSALCPESLTQKAFSILGVLRGDR